MFDYRRNLDVKSILPSLGEKIRNFSDTADILSQVDLLISTDTAPIHMGGALGVPTWGLLHFSADWRWFTRDIILTQSLVRISAISTVKKNPKTG